MRFLLVIGAIALTVLSWGLYGPVLHHGIKGMGGGRLLPFFFVGVAYFFIAVAVPAAWLRTRGEAGSWTVGGSFWSLMAGAAGALGALGIILAFKSGGSPVVVMPIVFGGAPIINSLISAKMNKLTREISSVFIAGLMMVILGAVTVLFNKPAPPSQEAANNSLFILGLVASIAGTVVCWGAYGPFLHKGQMKMQGSRLRPLLCVGLAYFAIAVLIPAILLSGAAEGGWATFSGSGVSTFSGTVWSLAAGAAGVFGSLGIIMAFNWGGKPIYVMPLVFGGAPVVNTLWALTTRGDGGGLSATFIAGLILVIGGSAMVLVFSPKGTAGKKKASEGEKKVSKQGKIKSVETTDEHHHEAEELKSYQAEGGGLREDASPDEIATERDSAFDDGSDEISS